MAGNTNQLTLRNSIPAYAIASLPLISPVPIQEVQLLDYAASHKSVNSSYGLTANASDTYVIGKDPYTSDEQRVRDQYEINDTDWHEVSFKEVIGLSSCKLALHQDWIESHDYMVDGIVNMNLPEQGISGPFKITSIRHIQPQKIPVDEDPDDDYEYRPVTGLFTHQSDDVYTIGFSDAITLGITATHPIYSTTYHDWRLAGELEVGERVLTYKGEATVSSTEKRAGSEPVYNLEVKDLHNFLVGDVGVVVHNNCLKEAAEEGVESKLVKEAVGDVIDEVKDEVGAEVREQALKKGRKLTWPEVLALFKRGNLFNKKGVAKYTNSKCEIHLGNGKRLDTYIPGEKIISRKATDLDQIEESTWRNYCNELITKYKRGTQVKSSKMPGEPPLSGNYFIEVPASNQSAQKLATFRAIAQSDYGIEDIIFLIE